MTTNNIMEYFVKTVIRLQIIAKLKFELNKLISARIDKMSKRRLDELLPFCNNQIKNNKLDPINLEKLLKSEGLLKINMRKTKENMPVLFKNF